MISTIESASYIKLYLPELVISQSCKIDRTSGFHFEIPWASWFLLWWGSVLFSRSFTSFWIISLLFWIIFPFSLVGWGFLRLRILSFLGCLCLGFLGLWHVVVYWLRRLVSFLSNRSSFLCFFKTLFGCSMLFRFSQPGFISLVRLTFFSL